MASILLVDDAKDCQILVRETLARSANIRVASSLSEARQVIQRERFDLILLDLTLPDGDGFEFFTELQGKVSEADTAVIFLTAKGDATLQVAAFSLGADDYVIKPVRPLEFRARVEARLKKISQARQQETLLIRGALRIELESQRAFIVEGGEGGTAGAKRDLDLTGREFKLLYHLARHEGHVFSRDQLITAVWGDSVHVLDRTIDTHIYTLRKKLGDISHYIESEVGLGYRLNSSAQSAPRKRPKASA